MLRSREHVDEPLEHPLEAALRVLRRKLRHRRRVSDNELQVRDQVDYELSVGAQRITKGVAPAAQLGVALAQERTDQAPERLRQRRIRDVTLVLVELARGEQPTGWDQHLVQLMNDSRLADAGMARDQHQLRRAASDDAVERRKQGLDLACP